MKKHVDKFFLVLIALALMVFLSNWTFNHINAWAGIAIAFLSVYVTVLIAVRFLKGK